MDPHVSFLSSGEGGDPNWGPALDKIFNINSNTKIEYDKMTHRP